MYYYNVVNDKYLAALKSKIRREKIMLEVLDYSETGVASVTNEITPSGSGSISHNAQNGARRACNISVVDIGGNLAKEFAPNAKFKVWYGICAEQDVHWFSQGIFSPKSTDLSDFLLSITAVDKFGFLNGELKTGAYTAELDVEADKGGIVGTLIEDILTSDLGNGRMIDSATPNIAEELYSTTLDTTITVGAGGHISEVLTQLAEWYGCNVFYDKDGRLTFEKIFDYGYPSRILQKASVFNFDDLGLTYDDLKISKAYDNCNTVIVATDNTDGDSISVTMENNNPYSPYSVDKVGARLYDGDGVTDGVYYIPIRSSSAENENACKDMAAYLLMKQTAQVSTISFEAPVIPHLQIGDVITVKAQDYVLQSLNIPLTAGGQMQIEAVSVEQLPYDDVS